MLMVWLLKSGLLLNEPVWTPLRKQFLAKPKTEPRLLSPFGKRVPGRPCYQTEPNRGKCRFNHSSSSNN